MLHFVCCRLDHVKILKTPIYLRDVTLKYSQMWYGLVVPVYTGFLDQSISASQSVSRNSEGHVESVQPIKCMLFILICNK
jgi:hypothetical protein